MDLLLPPILTEPFLIRALIAAILLAITGGVIGSFIQMRGMSFYTDTIAHSAFTGVALGILLQIDVGLSSVLFAVLIGLLVLVLRRRTRLTFDTVLGVLFATVAALGIFLLTFLDNVRVDLFGLLFGDILAISSLDLWVIALAAAVSLVVLWSIHRELVLEIIHPELADVEGVPTRRNDLIFGVVVATMIALGIKLIGIILLSGLFLIPSATSYLLAKSLRELVFGSVAIGIVAATVGVITSALVDSATGPTIVLTASLIFGAAYLLRPVLRT